MLSDNDLGDRRPTQLLNELSSLAQDRVSDDFLNTAGIECRFVKLVDKILEVSTVVN